jgi:hypothetical protein
MRSALADKLMQFSSSHSNKIAEQWYQALSTNTRTRAYSAMPRDACIRHAECIYKNLEKMYFAENPEIAVIHMLDVDGFVEDHYARSIPLEQVIYAIILLRRHLWLHAEIEALYDGVEDLLQMVENINRVLLVFDYLIFIVSNKYRLMLNQHR